MNSLGDTIVAPITGSQPAAVAVLRVSGSKSWLIASQVFGNWDELVKPRYALYGRFVTGDDGLALPFLKGHSFTGEESVEFSVHGSTASVHALLEACYVAGARPADPGEFTYRAFMNGRIDLSQAEGVRDTVDAITDAQLRYANGLREGQLSSQIGVVKEHILKVLVAIEASTDFSEEVGEVDRGSAHKNLEAAKSEIERLLESASREWVVRRGLKVAIIGRPNSGKSSLLNAIVGSNRAIVTDVPGTTRDTIEEVCSVIGMPVRFIDTAGLRESEDVVESIGIMRTRESADQADHVWYVYDQNVGWDTEDEASINRLIRPFTIVANKCDLPMNPADEAAYRISAVSGDGVEHLLESLRQYFEDLPEALPNRRHSPLLSQALDAVSEGVVTLSTPVPDDLAAVQLRTALRLLGEITGETATPDILERVFHDFCIGK